MVAMISLSHLNNIYHMYLSYLVYWQLPRSVGVLEQLSSYPALHDRIME